jgi:integrase
MKLLDQVHVVMRKKHYSIRTEQAYVNWIRQYILFQGKHHPKDMGKKEIGHVLQIDLGDFGKMERARKPERLPTLMTKAEVRRVLAAMSGIYGLMTKLIYGSGLRSIQCVRLRVKDIDFDRSQVMIRDGKGMKYRVTMLPEELKPFLLEHLGRVKTMHERDLQNGLGQVYLPFTLERKYSKARRKWGWGGRL